MSIFSKIKEAFVKSEDKDKYLSGLDRSKKSFGDRMRALSNNFHGIDDDLLEQIMVILLESDVGIHTALFPIRSRIRRAFRRSHGIGQFRR